MNTTEIKKMNSVNQESLKNRKNSSINKKEYKAEKLANLARLCIGNRTLVQFSAESGLSVSFLSRLINGKLNSKPTKKSLNRIAYPSYGKAQNNVTYLQLLEAAGYHLEDEQVKKAVAEAQNSVPEYARKLSFSISFMIDNLIDSNEIGLDFNIQTYNSIGWFVISSMNLRILCVPIICEESEVFEKKQMAAVNFMVAVTTQKNLDKYYILTNQENFSDEIKTVLPKLPGIDVFILETFDYQKISGRKLVYEDN